MSTFVCYHHYTAADDKKMCGKCIAASIEELKHTSYDAHSANANTLFIKFSQKAIDNHNDNNGLAHF